jgi:glycosyltransferase involved in cell wall biosynthesis
LDVSIIIPSHNKAAFVADAVASALSQGDRCEVIVVDDASTDGSREILRGISASHPALRLIELPVNRGGSHCRNIGLREARGTFAMFLDADDLLRPGCCTGRLDAALRHADHDLWVFPMQVFRDDPASPTGEWVPNPGPHLDHFLAHRLDWSVMQPLWRREFLVRIGGFDEGFVRLQDPELHVRALLAGARVKCFPNAEADCLYRIDMERHGGDCESLAKRHVAGAVHFYRAFAARVQGRHRRLLSGTLMASIATIEHWRRTGKVDPTNARRLVSELIDCCDVPAHRALLRAYAATSRGLPLHLPGLSLAARAALRL